MNLQKEIEIIVNNNCTEIPYEGTAVNKSQLKYGIKELAIKFAKLHCIEQAKVISEKLIVNEFFVFGLTEDEERISSYDLTGLNGRIDKDLILNAYDLNDIK